MRALEAYRAELIELDKYESPSFSIRDFNHFWNSATQEFISSKLATGPDVVQYDHDDLAVLLSDPTPLVFGTGSLSNQAPLPNTYQNMLGMKITLEYLVNKGIHKKGDLITTFPKKQRSNREGFIQKNAYQEAFEEDSWYNLRGKLVEIIHDPDTKVKSGTINFLKKPAIVTINPLIATLTIGEQNAEVNNPTLEFPDATVLKIVKECRRIFLENIESRRYGTNIQEQNQRTN
jgi:hypothetical protein